MKNSNIKRKRWQHPIALVFLVLLSVGSGLLVGCNRMSPKHLSSQQPTKPKKIPNTEWFCSGCNDWHSPKLNRCTKHTFIIRNHHWVCSCNKVRFWKYEQCSTCKDWSCPQCDAPNKKNNFKCGNSSCKQLQPGYTQCLKCSHIYSSHEKSCSKCIKNTNKKTWQCFCMTNHSLDTPQCTLCRYRLCNDCKKVKKSFQFPCNCSNNKNSKKKFDLRLQKKTINIIFLYGREQTRNSLSVINFEKELRRFFSKEYEINFTIIDRDYREGINTQARKAASYYFNKLSNKPNTIFISFSQGVTVLCNMLPLLSGSENVKLKFLIAGVIGVNGVDITENIGTSFNNLNNNIKEQVVEEDPGNELALGLLNLGQNIFDQFTQQPQVKSFINNNFSQLNKNGVLNNMQQNNLNNQGTRDLFRNSEVLQTVSKNLEQTKDRTMIISITKPNKNTDGRVPYQTQTCNEVWKKNQGFIQHRNITGTHEEFIKAIPSIKQEVDNLNMQGLLD